MSSATTAFPYADGETVLKVSGVNKFYGDKHILRDVNLEIKNVTRPGIIQGQVCTIVGRSGGGKSTLSKIIANLLKPDSGEILISNGPSSGLRPVKRGEVGYVFQNYLVYDHLTVQGSLLLAAYQGKYGEHLHQSNRPNAFKRWYRWVLDQKDLQERAGSYLEMFKLAPHVDQYASELSGGQKQRLAVLSQVLCSHKTLILDEPFTAQDFEMKMEMCELIMKVAQFDDFETIIPITHDIESALWISDHIYPLGLEKDDKGERKPGSTMFQPINTARAGLAWHDRSILRDAQFHAMVQEIRYVVLPNIE